LVDRPQTDFDLAQTAAKRQLCESHAQELIEAGKISNPIFALIALHAQIEFVPRKEIHQLGKYKSSGVHQPILSMSSDMKYGLIPGV
jgi:hypothetical protein